MTKTQSERVQRAVVYKKLRVPHLYTLSTTPFLPLAHTRKNIKCYAICVTKNVETIYSPPSPYSRELGGPIFCMDHTAERYFEEKVFSWKNLFRFKFSLFHFSGAFQCKRFCLHSLDKTSSHFLSQTHTSYKLLHMLA